MHLKVIDAGIDWHTEIFFSDELVDPDKRKVLLNSFIAYVDPTLKPTKKNAWESEFRYLTINSRSLLYQHRGWGWATHGSNFLYENDRLREKILKCFSANRIALSSSGTSRLDFQFTIVATAEEMQRLGALNNGTGSYKEYYKMNKGQREFRGYTLYASEYRIRLYNKTREAAGDEKKDKWLKEKMQDQSGEAWRFEVQVDRNFQRYLTVIDEFKHCTSVFEEDSRDDYMNLTKKLFAIFNSRLKIGLITKFVGRTGLPERESLSDSAKEVA